MSVNSLIVESSSTLQKCVLKCILKNFYSTLMHCMHNCLLLKLPGKSIAKLNFNLVKVNFE